MTDLDDLDDLDDLGAVKTPLWKNPAVLVGLLVCGGGGGWYAYTEANPTAGTWVKRGNSALAGDDHAVARSAFEAALVLEPGRMDAHRGVAEALGRSKDWAGQVDWLKKASGLEAASPVDARRLKTDLAAAAMSWAKSVEGRDDAAYDKALSAAAAADLQSPAHSMLAAHLMALADMHSQRGEHGQAAAHAARARTYKIKKKDRMAALEAEIVARVALFAPEFTKEFKAKHEPALIKSKQYDVANGGFYVRIESEIPWSGSTRTSAQVRIHEVNVKNQANKLVRSELLKLLGSLAGPGADPAVLAKLPPTVTAWEQKTWSEGWARHPTKYALGVVVPFEEATRLIWLMRSGATLLKAD